MKILFLARRYSYFRNFDSVIREPGRRAATSLHLAVDRETPRGCRSSSGSPPEFPTDHLRGAAAARRRRLDVDGGPAAPRHRAPALSAPDVRRHAEAAGALGGADARAGSCARRVHPPSRRGRAGPVVGAPRLARTGRRPENPRVPRVHRAPPARPRAAHPAHRPGLVSRSTTCAPRGRWAFRPGSPCGAGTTCRARRSSASCPIACSCGTTPRSARRSSFTACPTDRIVVTGAQCFDRWFGRRRRATATRSARRSGCRRSRPFILYVCSAPFIGSQPEAPFVVDWVRRVRASASARAARRADPRSARTRRGGRSGPASTCRALRDVVVWGSSPVDRSSRNDYFDSLYHSAAVVGLNTSAFIEAGIVGRPVLTILLPEWHENQLGTAHFRYLFEAGGGLLDVRAQLRRAPRAARRR